MRSACRQGKLPRIADMAEPLPRSASERFGETALQEAILAVDKFTERVVNRQKNSPAVALETLVIELLKATKRGVTDGRTPRLDDYQDLKIPHLIARLLVSRGCALCR